MSWPARYRDARVLFWTIALLLVIALSRLLPLSQLTFDEDEIRSIMRSYGTPAQIIAWQPDDWPPLYDLELSAWRTLTGSTPFALRFSSVLTSILGAGFAYRLGLRLFGSARAAVTLMLAYCALGYVLFLSIYLRGYVVCLALFPLALWWLVRYFDRPRLRHGVGLGLVLAIMFYMTYTTALACLALGLYSVMRYRAAVWRWWLPGGTMALLVLPELARGAGALLNRTAAASSVEPVLPPPLEAIVGIYRDYAGQAVGIWLLLLVLALLLVRNDQRRRMTVVWSLVVALLAPVVLYILSSVPVFYYFTARYAWWALLPIALVLAAGLSRLRRWPFFAVQLLLVGALFVPLGDYTYTPLPLESVFSWLARHKQPGDVLVIDPNFCILYCRGANSEESKFQYYKSVFAADVSLVDAPGDARRVWYLSQSGWHDADFAADVSRLRVAREFVGPWNLLLRLYEGPPDREGVRFANGLRFHGVDILRGATILQNPIYANEQEALTLRLWWSVDQPLDQEYSIAVKLARGEVEQVSLDGPPQLVSLDPTAGSGTLPTSMLGWTPGQLYVEERTLTLPAAANPFRPTLYLTVYQWWDGVRLPAPGLDETGLLPLGRIRVWGY